MSDSDAQDEAVSSADGAEADVLEQEVVVGPDDGEPTEGAPPPEMAEADPADVMDQRRAVPFDDERW